MPEIGEAEVVRTQLHAGLVGATLVGVTVLDSQLGEFASDAARLLGQRLTGTARHGKLLGLRFADEFIVCHLRMTGALTFTPRSHTRAVLRFTAPAPSLTFSDPRRFGTLTVTAVADFAAGHGPDVLDEPAALAGVYPRLHRSGRPLKAALLDQTLIAGLGNWMADELAHRNGLAPTAPARELTRAQWAALMADAHALALRSVTLGGSSLRDYVHPDGERGRMQDELCCYGRAGHPCRGCGRPLEHLRVAGRGTTMCPACQPRR